ncbi:MAG: hypothetical protein H6Q69_2186 [Firmicutes bacterium]|nr:hypothetical protein [Bacillota bacterium]
MITLSAFANQNTASVKNMKYVELNHRIKYGLVTFPVIPPEVKHNFQYFLLIKLES